VEITALQQWALVHQGLAGIESYKGLRDRMPALVAKVLRRLGAGGGQTARRRDHPSLQSGAIDASEFTAPGGHGLGSTQGASIITIRAP